MSHPHDGHYEAPNGDPIPFYRADQRVICEVCKLPYGEWLTHKTDPREPCLTVLCDGQRVKL